MRRIVLIVTIVLLSVSEMFAATLAGSFSAVAQGSNVNLTAEGKLDWIHWGLENDTSYNRKATVIPQISDFTVVYNTNITFAAAYQYADNYNGYSWSDGTQVAGTTNTTTGVYILGGFNAFDTNGLVFTVPADTTLKTLKVYVGTYAARGRFTATLSDPPMSYTDTSLSNFRNGPGGVYTISFAANSADQTLTIRWCVDMKNQPDGNVTLQAATLSASGANNPPFARITSPSLHTTFPSPANIIVTADAFDFDGSISKVEFYNNGTKMGDSKTSPYSFTWNGVTPGCYRLTARPLDDAGAISVSVPVDIFVHSSGGTLNGSVTSSPAGVDLTSVGSADWVHWGLTNAFSVNRKASVPQQISSMTKLGTNVLQRAADSETGVTWSDGTPVSSVANSTTAVFISGVTNGFQFSVPAKTNAQSLKVYVSLYGGAGNFQAWLTDFSASAYCDRSLTNAWGNSNAVYTLNYAAASSLQSLQVRYTADYVFDQDYGNVALQATTLDGPVPVYLSGAEANGNEFSFSFPTSPGTGYTVEYNDSLSLNGWQVLTNVVGTGGGAVIFDTSYPQRFYRVKTD